MHAFWNLLEARLLSILVGNPVECIMHESVPSTLWQKKLNHAGESMLEGLQWKVPVEWTRQAKHVNLLPQVYLENAKNPLDMLDAEAPSSL